MIPPVQKSEEDLIEPLLERLEDLKLIANRSEGARYVLELALTVAPARVGLVHLYEPGTSEFCAEAVLGERALALEGWTSEEQDIVLSEALREKRLVHITAPRKNPRVSKGRWAVILPKHALVTVPCQRAGRPFGAIELVDPHERDEFARNQLNALTYLAGEFAKYLEALPHEQRNAS